MLMNGLFALLGIFFILLSSLVGLALYAVFAYSFYKMAINAGMENPWMAWIPILQWYVLGKLIKSLKISTYQIPNLEIVLPAASLIIFILRETPVIGGILSLANYVLLLFAFNKLYRMYKPEQATLYTILSIFGLPIPFIFYSIKDLKPVYVQD
jgi:hypothetical protein